MNRENIATVAFVVGIVGSIGMMLTHIVAYAIGATDATGTYWWLALGFLALMNLGVAIMPTEDTL